MVDAPDSDTLEHLMTRYVLGDLSRAEAGEFERLLAENPKLAAEVSSLRKTWGLLPYAVAAEPPPHLRSRILTAAQAAPRRSAGQTLRRLPWSRMVGAIAALLAVVIGLDNYYLRREIRLQKEVTALLQQPNVFLSFSLAGTGTFTQAVGSVALDLDAKKAAVVIHGLPVLPAGQVYRLWALLAKGEHVPCGQFNANAQGAIFSQLSVPVDAYTSPIKQLIVTREPSSAPPRPVGPTVLASS